LALALAGLVAAVGGVGGREGPPWEPRGDGAAALDGFRRGLRGWASAVLTVCAAAVLIRSSEIISTMAGRALDDELLHTVRLRLRRLGDEVYALTRVATAFIDQRQRIRARCAVDPVRVCAGVRSRTATGMTVTDAFIEIADEFGAAPETIRNAYYKHRHEYEPKRRK
jgi:hypothetical protein